MWAIPTFRVLFTTRCLGTIADTLRTVALSVLIFATTGSALLGALAYGMSFLPQLLGGSLLGALADRLPPRRLIAAGYAAECGGATVLGTVDLPVWGSLLLVAVISGFTPVFTGASSRVLADVLTGDTYVLGRALSSMASSASQLLGLAAGGAAVAAVGPRHALLVSAGCHLVAALGVWLRLPYIAAPGRDEPESSRSMLAQSWRGNLRLLADRRIRELLFAQWLPPLFVTGAEGLVVPYVGERGHAGSAAGWLLACVPAGMIVGNFVLGRFVPPGSRERLLVPLVAVLGLPLTAFVLALPLVLAGALLVVTGFGFAYGLGVQQQFREAVPIEVRGQAFTFLSTGLMTLQGIGPALGGAAAAVLPASQVIAVSGVAILAVAMWLGWRGRLDEGAVRRDSLPAKPRRRRRQWADHHSSRRRAPM